MRLSSLCAILAIFLFIPFSASASEYRTGEKVVVEAGKKIEGNLFVFGNEVTVDGDVLGDIYCAGKDIRINGFVAGSIFCAGERVYLASTTAGSAYLAGGDVSLAGKVMQNLYVLSNGLKTDKASNIGWDFAFSADKAEINGSTEKDVYGSATGLRFGGKIGKNMKVYMSGHGTAGQGLEVLPGAEIKESLSYYSGEDARISEGAIIGGAVENKQDKDPNEGKRFFYSWIKWRIFGIFSALISGLVIVSIFRKQTVMITDDMLSNTSNRIALGAVIFIIVPIIAIVLALTVIGIPLALSILALWLISVYAGKLFAGILIGRSIIEKTYPASKDSLVWAMILGIIISYLLFAVPLAGWVLSFFAILWGMVRSLSLRV